MSNIKLLEPQVADAFFGGFPSLRPVQEATLKPLVKGRNVVACSGTGSGKTEAALAPLVSRYWKEFDEVDATLIIYVAPTKALVNDLAGRLEDPMERMYLRLGVRHGDRDSLNGRKKSPHVVITTPESLDVMLFRDDKALKTVCALVIDEVHLFYNTQRGVQLSILVERLKTLIDADRLQLVALSATIVNLKEVGRFFFGKDGRTDFLDFPATRKIDTQIRSEDFGSVVEKLTKGRACKLLAFANRRKDCEELAESVSGLKHLQGAVFTHYSSLSKHKREEVEEQFRSLKKALCNATSTLELGIDIGDIDAVLLCGVPAKIDSFLQRIGRGNRRTNTTVACCFTDLFEADALGTTDALRYVALIDAAKKGELSGQGAFELFGAVAQQCLSIIASRKEFTSVKRLCSIFEKLPYVDRPTVESILSKLEEDDYLVKHGTKNQYGAGEQLHKLVRWRRVYGNFPVEARMVELRHGDIVIGEVPDASTALLPKGTHVKFAAARWKVRAVTDDCVELEPSNEDAYYHSYDYYGSGMNLEAFVNDRMWSVIHTDEYVEEKLIAGGLRDRFAEAKQKARQLCKETRIPYRVTDEGILYYTFAGALVNRAVAVFTRKTDFKVGDHDLLVDSYIDWKCLPTDPADYEPIFGRMFHPTGYQSIFQKMLPRDLQVREYVQEWLNDEAIPRVLTRLAAAESVKAPEWPFR